MHVHRLKCLDSALVQPTPWSPRESQSRLDQLWQTNADGSLDGLNIGQDGLAPGAHSQDGVAHIIEVGQLHLVEQNGLLHFTGIPQEHPVASQYITPDQRIGSDFAVLSKTVGPKKVAVSATLFRTDPDPGVICLYFRGSSRSLHMIPILANNSQAVLNLANASGQDNLPG